MYKREGGRGGWNQKNCVPKVAQIHCVLHISLFPTVKSGSRGGGGGVMFRAGRLEIWHQRHRSFLV